MKRGLVVVVALVITVALAPGLWAAFPEVGANDFRISWMGPSGDTSYAGVYPDVAYNAQQQQYLVVWSGNDTGCTSGLFARRVDASTGLLLGPSHIVVESDTGLAWQQPAVVYNPMDNEYLVAYDYVVENRTQVAARFIDGVTGTVGSARYLLSIVGSPTGTYAGAPAVAFSENDDIYLVAWTGETEPSSNETEIYCRFMYDHQMVGVPFRISDMGPDGEAGHYAENPSVAFNGLNEGDLLVVWSGTDALCEWEIYGQLLDSNGTEIGDNDFRISSMGPEGSCECRADTAAVTFCEGTDEYLVVWSGNDPPRTAVGESEIFGQRLNELGHEEGEDDFRISHMGPDGESYLAKTPHLEVNPTAREYLVVWSGDDDSGGMVNGEREIFGQYLSLDGREAGPDDFRLSDMGGNGDYHYQAVYPAVAESGSLGEYLVVWNGDDNVGGLVDNEGEIFGQRLLAGGLFGDGFESGGTASWSSTQAR